MELRSGSRTLEAPRGNCYAPAWGMCVMMVICIRYKIRYSTIILCQWAPVLDQFWGPETPPLCFLTVAECPSYTAVHRRSDLPCCCCPYLEQSAPTCHVRTHYVCFPRLLQGFPLQAFHPMTYHNFCSACALCSDSCHFQTLKWFFLLTYLPTYLLRSLTYYNASYHLFDSVYFRCHCLFVLKP